MTFVTACPSNSQVNRAGRILRKVLTEADVGLWDERVAAAGDTLLAFRAAHQYPLTKASMGLRSMVKTEHCPLEISQRLKRVPTILDKLCREPTMQLANMQDIGGCRAVLENIDQLRRVERRLRKNRPPLRISDYVGTPKTSGYRGVHVIVQYDGRTIEVQLRTQVMHSWAITVERLSGRLREDFKSGRGPHQVQDFLSCASEAMAIEEVGGIVDQKLLDRLGQLRQAALPYLGGGTSA